MLSPSLTVGPGLRGILTRMGRTRKRRVGDHSSSNAKNQCPDTALPVPEVTEWQLRGKHLAQGQPGSAWQMTAPLHSQALNGELFSPLQGSLQEQFSLKPMLGFPRERHYVCPRAGQAKPMCSRDQAPALPISVDGEEGYLGMSHWIRAQVQESAACISCFLWGSSGNQNQSLVRASPVNLSSSP